jgi:uncharacterized protein
MGLRLVERRTRRPAPKRDGRFVLQGERQWLLRGDPDAVARAVAAMPGVAERLGARVALLAFGNTVGLLEVPGLGRVEIRSGKWSERDFDAMLVDLTSIAAGLPFSAGTDGAFPYERGEASEDVLYHAFVYLRFILSDTAPAHDRLAASLQAILSDPHRRWRRTAVPRPPHEVMWVDERTLLAAVQAPAGLVRAAAPPWSRTQLAVAFRGHIPERLLEPQVEVSFDTPENRFVKSFLEHADHLVRRFEDAFGASGPALRQRVRADCALMRERLEPLRRAALWQSVGAMAHIPAASTVLHRKRGYRDVFRHFARLRLAARLPLDRRRANDLLQAKNIADLYELWCFFRVARELEAMLGPAIAASHTRVTTQQVEVPWELAVTWSGGVRLCYNRSFRHVRPPAQGSYSLTLRPDIVLEVPSGLNAGLHVLDAKFRIQSWKSASSGRSFKPADLHKMHAYLDAIAGARTSWVLYPGEKYRFYSRAGAESGAALLGVGAIPLRPGEKRSVFLRRVLRELVAGSPT